MAGSGLAQCLEQLNDAAIGLEDTLTALVQVYEDLADEACQSQFIDQNGLTVLLNVLDRAAIAIAKEEDPQEADKSTGDEEATEEADEEEEEEEDFRASVVATGCAVLLCFTDAGFVLPTEIASRVLSVIETVGKDCELVEMEPVARNLCMLAYHLLKSGAVSITRCLVDCLLTCGKAHDDSDTLLNYAVLAASSIPLSSLIADDSMMDTALNLACVPLTSEECDFAMKNLALSLLITRVNDYPACKIGSASHRVPQ
eukprot:NODE_1490_length_1714_cov_117.379007_g1413_i0.p2 GENE.NODE_1490_length_1714_cov_117.379007_g1413_i0~~NODE_1490_length_1714_cov_117.379007_g1413_i0.p2  ORF type:complete len:257 (-),score=49.46 NODE_1490_length_1714_cov_117.379007_g1413_i0:885-1655(-)